jgi:ribosomal protein S18 acetylase RimI-like enzyme
VSDVRLRPLREDELAAHVERSRGEYAADLEQNGGMSAEDARAKAVRDLASLFPDGRPAEGQLVFAVEDVDTGAAVGRVHFAERPPGSGRAWLYDVAIDERLRGRGLGRKAMELFEAEARSRGYTRVALNVFGGNERARSLYRSLGYQEVAVEMTKDLSEQHAW